MTILTIGYLNFTLQKYSAIRNKILRMVKNKELIPVKRGLYATTKDSDPRVLASWITKPSYLSFQYALSWHGIIPERVVEYTSATFGKNKRKVFDTSFGRFTYQDVPESVFWYGQMCMEPEDGCFFIATKEKAVCDMLNALPGQGSMKDFIDLIFEDMRMDEDILQSLSLSEIQYYSNFYHSSNIRYLIKFLQKTSVQEQGETENMPNTKIEAMISQYDSDSLKDKESVIKEILQELILFALSQTDFFQKAAFYGGTALRICYGLARFSEDLDFSLLKPDPDFSFESYLPEIESVLSDYGFHVQASQKNKGKYSPVRSAFVKGNTKELTLTFFPDVPIKNIQSNQVIKIKFEADTMPPEGAYYETKILELPLPHQVLLYDLPSLFAGKIHAVLCRSWKNRIKGRDLFDYLFYVRRKTPVNLASLNEKLRQSGYLKENENLSLSELKEHLKHHFENLDYDLAKKDVAPFLRHDSYQLLEFWNAQRFVSTLDHLKESDR